MPWTLMERRSSTSETIDISAYTDVSISFYLSETGDLDDDDYFRAYYVLDGGGETLFETNGDLIDDFDDACCFANRFEWKFPDTYFKDEQ